LAGLGGQNRRVINLLPNLVNDLTLATHRPAIDPVDNYFHPSGISGANGDAVLTGPAFTLTQL
jgi:hypothetical protein